MFVLSGCVAVTRRGAKLKVELMRQICKYLTIESFWTNSHLQAFESVISAVEAPEENGLVIAVTCLVVASKWISIITFISIGIEPKSTAMSKRKQ